MFIEVAGALYWTGLRDKLLPRIYVIELILLVNDWVKFKIAILLQFSLINCRTFCEATTLVWII